MCGEKAGDIRKAKRKQGSPPRVRGKGLLSKKCLLRVGITPACAGKRCGARLAAGHRRDHPRVCGEKLALNVIPNSIKGSPPRVRGKDASKALGEAGGGITPACAGKRGWTMVPESTSRDHPRVCGEKSPLSKESVLEWGSPPRVRGKGEVVSRCGIKARITPACAGKRATPSGFRRPRRDHPRVCGEKAAYLRAVWVPKGSPPRVRGKVSHAVTAHLLPGITPACAGKRAIVSYCHKMTGDHPRVCGEKVSRIFCPGSA